MRGKLGMLVGLVTLMLAATSTAIADAPTVTLTTERLEHILTRLPTLTSRSAAVSRTRTARSSGAVTKEARPA